MLEAMSTGDGSVCTIHARSARQAHRPHRHVVPARAAGHDRHRSPTGSPPARSTCRQHPTLLDESHLGGRQHRFVDEVLAIEGTSGLRPPRRLTTVFGPGPDGRAVPQHRPAGLPDLCRAGFDPGFLDQPARHLGRPPLDVGTCDGDRGTRSEHCSVAAVAGACSSPGCLLAVAGTRSRQPRRPASRPDQCGARGGAATPARRCVAVGSGAGGGGAVAAGGGAGGVVGNRLAGRRADRRRRGRRSAARCCPPPSRRGRSIDRLEAVEDWTRRLADVLIVGVGLEQAITATLRTVPAPIRPEVARSPPGWSPAGPPRRRCGPSPTTSTTRPATWWPPR